MTVETWDLWYPNAAAVGLSFARGRMAPAEVVLVHAAPETLRVEVRDDAGLQIAFGDQLRRDGQYFPMTRLKRTGVQVTREDDWPEEADIGRPVLLPGGEVGILLEWWNADDGSAWRWSVEFSNGR